jgi:hypothetical protein
LVALVIAALVALSLVLGGDDEDPHSAAAGGSATATSATEVTGTGVPTPPPSPEPTGPADNGYEPPPALPAVPLDAVAEVGNGIVATIPGIEAVQSTARGPGNIAGPALRVTVRITNGAGEPVSLDGVAVNMAYGPTATPASPLDDPSQRPFRGVVDPGGAAEGVYVFQVPTDARDSVTIEVGYRAGASLMLFTGPVT